MNDTILAFKMIQSYISEHNRVRRSHAAYLRAIRDPEWVGASRAMAICAFYGIAAKGQKRKQMLKAFHNAYGKPITSVFVSSGIKRATISKLNSELKYLETYKAAHRHSVRWTELEDELNKTENTPVNTKLGKMWRRIVNAQFDEAEARESRWQARCAINAFNKWSNIKIKFGNCSRGGGSMSYVDHVVIDGFKIKLSKFMENALFETAILTANPNV